MSILLEMIINKKITSRATILEVGDITIADEFLRRFDWTKIKAWEFLNPNIVNHPINGDDLRFVSNCTKKPLAPEYEAIVFEFHGHFSELKPYLNPFLARFLFVDVVDQRYYEDLVKDLAKYGYTVLRYESGMLFAQFLYKNQEKYPHGETSDPHGFHCPDTPPNMLAYMSRKEIAYLQEVCKGKTYMEIGSYDGFSAFMVNQVAEKMICIDPYDTAPARLGNVMKNNVYPNLHKLVNITGLSQYCSWIFQDGLVDVLLIDGDHHYQAVKNDYHYYRRIVKRGGLICFHDYGNFATVSLAVDTEVLDPWVHSVEQLCVFKKG